MAILNFFASRAIEAFHSRGIGRVRATEVLASGTSSTVAADGDVLIVTNDSGSAIKVAVGTTPVAATTTATLTSSAYFSVLPNTQSPPFVLKAGDKIAIA